MAIKNVELQRMLDELGIALEGADQKNELASGIENFRQGQQAEAAKSKATQQAAGAAAAQAAGGTGQMDDTAGFNASFDRAMAQQNGGGGATGQSIPDPVSQFNNDQMIQQELATRQQLASQNAAAMMPTTAGVDPRIVGAVSQPTAMPIGAGGMPPGAVGGGPMGSGAPPVVMGPQGQPVMVGALDMIAQQQMQGMGAGMPPATAGVPVGGAVAPQMPAMDPRLAAFLASQQGGM